MLAIYLDGGEDVYGSQGPRSLRKGHYGCAYDSAYFYVEL